MEVTTQVTVLLEPPIVTVQLEKLMPLEREISVGKVTLSLPPEGIVLLGVSCKVYEAGATPLV